MRYIYFIVICSFISFSGCEKGSERKNSSDVKQNESGKITQQLFKGMYYNENGKNLFKDCDKGKKYLMDSSGETMNLKDQLEKFLNNEQGKNNNSVYAEFEGFFSSVSEKNLNKTDSVIIPTRILKIDPSKGCK